MAASFVRSRLHLQAWAQDDPRPVIDALSADILRYEAEMTRLKDVLCELENDWIQLTQRRNEYLSSVHPIRRIPTEVLAEIFSFSDSECRYEHDMMEESPAAGEALKHLAHSPLYTVSQVSSSWHTVAMGTPTLWKEIAMDARLWETSEVFDKVLLVLPQVLDRGGLSSLSISVYCGQATSPSFPTSILKLLAQQSERWQSASFCQVVLDLRGPSAATGRLPRLESLSLRGICIPGSLDIFHDAPRLQVVEVVCTPNNGLDLTQLPLQQLSVLRCDEPLLNLDTLISLLALPHLPASAQFQLRLMGTPGALSGTTTLREIVSPLSTFTLHLVYQYSPSHSQTASGRVFDSLTLPSLSRLDMNVNAYSPESALLYWPQTQFIHLAMRSGFSTHLQILHLWNVVIEQDQLLECLEHLSFLEHLAVSDISVLHNGASQILLSDALLVALTRKNDTPSLVPRLSGFMAHSMLKFDDKVLLQFARSRVDDVELFELDVFGIQGFVRELDSVVEEQLDELEKLAYMWEPVDDE
ncbi:hypothetical protein R3P38DRAFT_3103014 [Favolaschia claudopus]|uniref:F-box domain-containing protein n=1 Tax=Favolaschia claudopus TaxID=2862362 RepID=A0AAV9ZKQ5_9AGAR